MAEETQLADVLTPQDGQEVQDNAEVSGTAKADEAGEKPEPQATQDKRDDEEGHKRLGGWQRKIQKLERELEVWREHALKAQPAAKEQPSDKAPEPPDLETFQGTMGEFKAAQSKYAKDLEAYIAQRSERQQQQKDAEAAVRSFGDRLKQLPDIDEVQEAYQDANMSPALDSFLTVELAKLKNGPEVLRELLLDEDTRDDLLEMGRANDGVGIKALLVATSRALRIAQRNQPEAEKQQASPKPKPIAGPSSNSAATQVTIFNAKTPEEYNRIREAQIKERHK